MFEATNADWKQPMASVPSLCGWKYLPLKGGENKEGRRSGEKEKSVEFGRHNFCNCIPTCCIPACKIKTLTAKDIFAAVTVDFSAAN